MAGNGNGSGVSQLPVWARVVALIGLPGAIALYLVYVGSTYLPNTSTKVDIIYSEVVATRELVKEQYREQRIRSEAQYRMLQRICVNTAKTDFERRGCFD